MNTSSGGLVKVILIPGSDFACPLWRGGQMLFLNLTQHQRGYWILAGASIYLRIWLAIYQRASYYITASSRMERFFPGTTLCHNLDKVSYIWIRGDIDDKAERTCLAERA